MSFRFLATLHVLLVLSVSLTAVWAQDVGLEQTVDELAEEYVGNTIAGLSVGVSRGDEMLLYKTYGHANIEWDVSMPLDTVHEIGSITKQFTSAAILQLYGQELVDLDANINDYLPDYNTLGRRITVRQLMDHTSGIQGYTEIPEFGEVMTRSLPVEELLSRIEAYPLQFEPGEALVYNNSAFFLLGLIIEAVTGLTYEEYVEQKIFPLAGMDRSSYCSNSDVVYRKAKGYAYSGSEQGLIQAAYLDHRWPYAAGSLCSTVADLLAWNRALHNDEVLSSHLYDILITPRTLNDGTELRYAMGISHYQHLTGRVIEHGGGIPGFLSHSRYYPDDDLTVVVLINTTGPVAPTTIADAIGEHLFGDRGAPEELVFDGDLNQFAGVYTGTARGTDELTLLVEVNNDSLTVARDQGEETEVGDMIRYIGNHTFYRGNIRYTFESVGESYRLRYDSVGNYYFLDKVEDSAE